MIAEQFFCIWMLLQLARFIDICSVFNNQPGSCVFHFLLQLRPQFHNRDVSLQKGKNQKGKKEKERIRARFKREKGTYRPLPVILANVRSLRNTTDELQANTNYIHEYRTA